jgi:GT2 family glycosyltransferase
MDEAYFLYLEDVDWCLRAARLGIETRFVPEAIVRHEVSRTLRGLEWADDVRYYAYRNQYRLAYKQGSIGARPLVVADAVWTLAKAGIRSVVSPDHRHDAHYHVRTVAVLDFFRRRWGQYPAAKRRATGAARAVSSK